MKRTITAKELAALAQTPTGVRIFDVRKRPAFDADAVVIADAEWRDHLLVDDWGPGLAGGGPVVCYCVHGHEVSQNAIDALRRLGVDARYLRGGIERWKRFGGALTPKP
jgi:thiosulfate sulfurtransferase